MHHQAQGARDIRIHFRFGHTGLLEMHDVVKAPGVQLTHQANRRLFRPSAKGHSHTYHCPHPLWLQQRQMPGHRCAPVMTDHADLTLP